MVLFAVAALAMAPVSFRGGNANELAKAIAEATRQPAIVAMHGNARFKAFEFEPADASLMARQIRQNADLAQAPGLQLAFSEGTVPPWTMEIEPIHRVDGGWPPGSVDPSGAVQDGKVTLKTSQADFLTFDGLAKMAFSKRLIPHWSLARTGFAVQAEAVPEREFLNHLAKTVGMKVAQTKDGFALEVEPAQFRLRAVNTIKKFATPEAMKNRRPEAVWTLQMTQLALQTASNEQIAEAFRDQGGSTIIPLSMSAKQQLAGVLGTMAREAMALERSRRDQNPQGEQVEVQILRSQRGRESGGSPAEALPRFMAQVDWRQEVALILGSNFRVQVRARSFPRRSAGPGSEGQTVTVQF